MKKLTFLLVLTLMSANIANAQIQKENPAEKLQARKTAVENKLNQKQDETLKKIDAKIAQARRAGKPTENLEKKRAEVLARISAKEKELNSRVDNKKAKIKK